MCQVTEYSLTINFYDRIYAYVWVLYYFQNKQRFISQNSFNQLVFAAKMHNAFCYVHIQFLNGVYFNFKS